MFSKIGIIIGREFNERVRKKSFIITTLLTPLLMIGLMAAPTLLLEYGSGETKQIAVVDESGFAAAQLESSSKLQFEPVGEPLAQAREERDCFGILFIGADLLENPSAAALYTNGSASMMVEEAIRSQLNRIVEAERLRRYDIDDLPQILESVKSDIRLQSLRNDDPDSGHAGSSAVAAVLGLLLGFVLYFILLIYGNMVMQSVIDEKHNRVLEVMVSSVRPFELMMGKILGIASVAVVQLLLWGVLLAGASSLLLPRLVPAGMLEQVQAMQAGTAVAADAALPDIDPDLLQAVAMAADFGYIARLFGLLLLFVVGGYLLYSAMYAAVGSAVDNAQDAQQLQTPITMPIILGFLATMTVLQDPDSPVAFWFSMIPFTSPLVMMARIPSGIPVWQIVTSLGVLYASFGGMVWVAGKIYRVGIFMYGKKPSLREIIKWVRYDS